MLSSTGCEKMAVTPAMSRDCARRLFELISYQAEAERLDHECFGHPETKVCDLAREAKNAQVKRVSDWVEGCTVGGE